MKKRGDEERKETRGKGLIGQEWKKSISGHTESQNCQITTFQIEKQMEWILAVGIENKSKSSRRDE